MARGKSVTPRPEGYVRRTKAIRSHKDLMPTSWFEDRSAQPLEAPPPLSELPEVEPGDLFYYNGPTDGPADGPIEKRFWILRKRRDGELEWRGICLGYKRKDGRRLALTEQRKEPSWIMTSWYNKRTHSMPPSSTPLSARAISPAVTPGPSAKTTEESSEDEAQTSEDGFEEDSSAEVEANDSSSYHSSG